MLIAIWAQSQNGVIGRDNQLPWRLPNDLKFFKDQTQGHPVVMGRRTFASMNYRPLPQRENIILSRQAQFFESDYDQSDVIITDQIEDILSRAQKQDVFIMGGASVYQLFWPYLDELRRTLVMADIVGDTYFNPDLSTFSLYHSVDHPVDDQHAYPYRFEFYRKR